MPLASVKQLLQPALCCSTSKTFRLAPIHEVQVNIAESSLPQVFVYIKGGLSNSCPTFHELTVERSGNTTNIEVTMQRPGGNV